MNKVDAILKSAKFVPKKHFGFILSLDVKAQFSEIFRLLIIFKLLFRVTIPSVYSTRHFRLRLFHLI
jgi:hypothetical protein